MSSDRSGSLMGSMLLPQSHFVKGALALSRATMTAFGTASSGPEHRSVGDGSGTRTADESAGSAAPAVEAGEEKPAWDSDRSADEPASLGVGDEVSFTKPIGDDDVQRFAAASGDTNPIHLDESAAEATRFGGRIAHGTLVSGLISAALARLPGTVVYLSQDMEFLAPVELDSEATATCRIVEDLGDDRFRLTTVVEVDGQPCIDGEAVVLIER